MLNEMLSGTPVEMRNRMSSRMLSGMHGKMLCGMPSRMLGEMLVEMPVEMLSGMLYFDIQDHVTALFGPIRSWLGILMNFWHPKPDVGYSGVDLGSWERRRLG